MACSFVATFWKSFVISDVDLLLLKSVTVMITMTILARAAVTMSVTVTSKVTKLAVVSSVKFVRGEGDTIEEVQADGGEDGG